MTMSICTLILRVFSKWGGVIMRVASHDQSNDFEALVISLQLSVYTCFGCICRPELI